MKEKILSEKDTLELSSRQESHFYDRKARAIDGKKIQKISTAFAYADGGDFVIGIKDDKDKPEPSKRWDGNPTKEDFDLVFLNLVDLKPSVPLYESIPTA